MKTRLVAAFTAVLSLACALFPASPVGAVTASRNEVVSSFTLTAGPGWYKYGTGTKPVTVPSTAGTQGFVSTGINTAGQVELTRFIPGSSAPSSVPWWNGSWRARQCSTATGVGVQFVDVPFNSMTPAGWAASGWVQANYGDLVPTVWNGTTQATTPFWLATPYDTVDGHVFVQVDFGAGATRTICLNVAHATGGQVSSSNPQLGENWAALTAVYELTNPFGSTLVAVSNPTSAAVTVATNPGGGGSVTLAAGATTTINLTGQRTLYSNGAIIVRGTNTTFADETLAPLFHQGTLFVSRANRNVQQWCFSGASGTTITIDPSSGAPSTFSLNAGTPCRTVDTTTHTVITSSAPVSVFHVSTNAQDPYPLYPATDDALYGIPSRNFLIGANGAGTFTLVNSSDASTLTLTAAVSGGEPVGATSSLSSPLGGGPAYRLTPVGGLLGAAIQQADSTGTDSTSFLPIEAMSSRYVLPVAAGYTSIACPRPGEVILVNGSPNACSGVNVGHILLGPTAAGAVIESQSGAAFYLYYQPGTDETNALIPRVNWAAVESVPGPLESAFALSGSWTASVSSVSKLWGLMSSTAVSIPAGTAVQWQVGCAPTSAGPFTYVAVLPGDPVPHSCDGLAVVSVKALLSTTNAAVSPTVGSFVVEHSLLVDSALVPSFDLSGTGRVWMWRIHDDGGSHATDPTMLRSATGTGSGAYQLLLVDNTMVVSSQLQVASGVMSSLGGAPVQLQVSSIAAQVVTAPSGSDRVVWRTLTPVWLEREFTVF